MLVEITSFMGAALKSLFDRENTVFIRYHSLTINKHLSKLDTPPWYVIYGRHPRIRLAMACVSKVGRSIKYFMQSLYAFKNLKALAHDLIPASLCEGPFFCFYVESVFLFLSIFHKQTLVSTLIQHLLYATYWTYYIALC